MTVFSSHSMPEQGTQDYSVPHEQAVQQPSLSSIPSGRPSYVPHPPYAPQQGAQRPVRSVVTISSLSLFSIVLCLIFFGAFTFLGGLLVGVSLGGTQTSSMVIPQPYTVVFPQGAQHPHPNGGSVYPTQSEMGQLAGTAAAGVVSAIAPNHVPHFFDPLKGEIQGLAIQHAATAAEKAVQRNPAPAPVPASQPVPGSPQSLAAPIASSPDNYAVRLGTFAAKENAKDLQNRLQALNYKTYLKKEESPQDTLYHVHSGKYETYATAAHAAQQFTKKSIPGTIVVKLPSDSTSGS